MAEENNHPPRGASRHERRPFPCARHLLTAIAMVSALLAGLAFTASHAAAEDLSYDVALKGIDGGEYARVRTKFKESSQLETEADRAVVSVANLRRTLQADIDLLTRILRSEGYYNSSISQTLTRTDNDFQIEIRVAPGSLYRFGAIDVHYRDPVPAPDIQTEMAKTRPLKTGDPARAEAVVGAEMLFEIRLPELGFPFSQPIERDLVVDHAEEVMNVTYIINTGERQRMGLTEFNGLKSVDIAYLARFITWAPGDYYHQTHIEDLRARLNKSGLFSSVLIDVTPATRDRANVVVKLSEAPHRTVSISGGYSTSEGPGGEVTWTHRNLFGTGNRLSLTGYGTKLEQSLASRFAIPNFKRLDQTLSFDLALRRQDTDAFFAYVVESQAGIDRIVTDNLALFANIDLEYSDITDIQGNRDFFLVSFPVGARWDSSDSLLDPTEGIRATFSTAPGYGIGDTNFPFLKSEFRASTYYALSGKDIVAALRTRLGSIIGPENSALPATRRFYAGGGGSIRGFAFQRVGPLDPEGDPIGGRSVTEIAAELRVKVSSTIGIVPFFEGGNVYQSRLPKLSGFRWSAGIGGRYHTGFGPVRLDIAFPLNPRDDDDGFQFYVSLGQAF